MWKCHKCGKPVYFAERKQSLGYDWHPECLRCEECGKRLNPGQHAEHKGVPYCHVPCYGALFGPQLFGHGTRVESHKSFGQQKDLKFGVNGPVLPRSLLDSKLKVYNQFYDGKSGEIRSREVNGRLILEGSLRIHWGIQGVIHLKENDDQRTVVTIRKRNSCRISNYLELDSDEEVQNILNDDSINDISAPVVDNNVITKDTENEINTSSGASPKSSPESPNKEFDLLPKSVTLPSNLNVKNLEWDELDELLQVERKIEDSDKVYQTMPTPLPSQYSCASIDQSKDVQNESVVEKLEDLNKNNQIDSEVGNDSIIKNLSKDDYWMQNSNHLNRSMSGPDCLGRIRDVHSPEFDDISIISNDISVRSENLEEIYVHKPAKTGSSAIKRRPGKRRSRTKIKRRCSINGHFYDRETSFFTPPHGSQMSVWVTSLVNTQEVINLMLEKYKVDSDPNNFALFIVRDNGEQKRLKDDEYPLLVRVLLGPHEDVVRLFLMDSHSTPEVSCEVAQFLNLSLVECRAILNQYYAQEEREVTNIIEKFQETKRRIKQRMEELKVRL